MSNEPLPAGRIVWLPSVADDDGNSVYLKLAEVQEENRALQTLVEQLIEAGRGAAIEELDDLDFRCRFGNRGLTPEEQEYANRLRMLYRIVPPL